MSRKTPLAMVLIALGSYTTVSGQDSKLNTNLGTGMSIPVGATGRLVGASMNAVVGAGYNFNKHHSFVGQFMWSGLPPDKEALRPIWIATAKNDISGSSNMFAVTANYRLQLQGTRFGVYLIGGGGVYYRHSGLSREVTAGEGTICRPAWEYFGFECFSGEVTTQETIASTGSTAFGGNAGVGFTIRINDDGYKFYIESRYHYAPNRFVATQFIPITLGFAW